MYCLYQHIRDDTGDVFYVGIGDSERPYEKTSRNKMWSNIVSKTSYSVDVVRHFDNRQDAYDWEILFIWIYGRRQDGGTLCNIALGGQGLSGYKKTREQIEKARDSMIRKKSYAIDSYDVKTREYIASHINITEASRYFGVNRGAVYSCVHGLQFYTKGVTFCHYGERPDWDQIDTSFKTGKSITGREKFIKKFAKPIIKISLDGIILAEYISAMDAAREFDKKSASSIIACANKKNGHNTAYGFKWEWKTL